MTCVHKHRELMLLFCLQAAQDNIKAFPIDQNVRYNWKIKSRDGVGGGCGIQNLDLLKNAIPELFKFPGRAGAKPGQ